MTADLDDKCQGYVVIECFRACHCDVIVHPQKILVAIGNHQLDMSCTSATFNFDHKEVVVNYYLVRLSFKFHEDPCINVRARVLTGAFAI